MVAASLSSALGAAALVLGIAALLAGLVLLTAQRSTRGGEPRCPACGYNLGGAQGLRCTSCGYTAWHAGELYRPQRSAARAVLGAGLVVSGLALVALILLAN